MKIQIKDQGKQFVYEVSKISHNMIDTEQLINSVYHPQSNGNDRIGFVKKKKNWSRFSMAIHVIDSV